MYIWPLTPTHASLKHASSSRFPVSPVDGDYQVLEVGYDSYVVVYSCSQILFFKYELGWILTRAPKVPDELVSPLLK